METEKVITQNRWQCVPMKKIAPEDRILNFKEVARGYTEEEAQKEASRCLVCPNPQCIKGCPIEVNIPGFIKLTKEKKYNEALNKIREKSVFPVICSRICPQEEQCQKNCVMGKKGDSVEIGRLERFIADQEPHYLLPHSKKPKTGKKVAVIGAGAAGLTVAANLAELGHEVTVFEALPFAGGVLAYGIPEFRLPKKILKKEIERIQKMGVKILTNTPVSNILTIKELFKQGFGAIFIGAGAGDPLALGVPGETLQGIYTANEFLKRVNFQRNYQHTMQGKSIEIGKKVVVVGGGNVAIDAARTSIRLGAEKVSIFYRRSKDEMPARKEEIINAEEEGIEFKFLVAPTRFIGDEQGRVKSMEYMRIKLGEIDSTGRRKPISIEGSETRVDVDFVIIAIGRAPNPLVQGFCKEINVGKGGIILVEDETSKTSHTGVYAGGDIATGEATVIGAMSSGRKAAKYIDEYLMRACRWPEIKIAKRSSTHSDVT